MVPPKNIQTPDTAVMIVMTNAAAAGGIARSAITSIRTAAHPKYGNIVKKPWVVKRKKMIPAVFLVVALFMWPPPKQYGLWVRLERLS